MPSGAPGPALRGRDRECEILDTLLARARAGDGQALVVRGEAGVGKTALLHYIARRASGCRIVEVVGIESEIELAFSGLYQMCSPLLDHLQRLPQPQHDALATAFGLRSGPPPDRFLVGLALLSLLAAVSEERPLICLVDDAQWLDTVSGQALAFVARRLLAEPLALVVATRTGPARSEFGALPELALGGLGDVDARALLDSAIRGPVDERVRHRLVVEARGNPLALLELPRGATTGELDLGVAARSVSDSLSRIERGFVERLALLPVETRRILLIAAADPLGDAMLLWRAARRLGLPVHAADAAEAAGLLAIGSDVRFRHPLVRSAVYRSAAPEERWRAHGALAEVTDPETDPDRRAWHRAQATPVPDDDVADELDRCATRAHARGGVAVAAAFLEHATTMTREPARRAERGLAAARAKRDAGALESALRLLDEVEAAAPDPLRTAEIARLRGQIAFDHRRASDAAPLLLRAARRLEPLNIDQARETHLEALGAAVWAAGVDGGSQVLEAAEAARAAPLGTQPPRPVDAVLDSMALRFTAGYGAAAPSMAEAVSRVRTLVRSDAVGSWLWLAGNRASGLIALELWDYESRLDLALRQVEIARERGAVVQLQFALNFLANTYLLSGRLDDAAILVQEDRVIAEATGGAAVAFTASALAALRGDEGAADPLIEATARGAAARGQGRMLAFAAYARAVLSNGLGRHDAARDAARELFRRDLLGFGPLLVPELADAASRTRDAALLRSVLDWLSERSRATPSAWVLGIEARVRALASEGESAERSFRDSIERLAGTPLRIELARSHLAYGEWLRGDARRVDARVHLRAAHEMLSSMGADGFAERARHELVATGEHVRRRNVERRNDFTAQEEHIARLASSGWTNPEIGAQLFLSPRTVEWHLRKVFTKLGITSRRELALALPDT